MSRLPGLFVFFCVRDTAATRGQYLALSKAWRSSSALCRRVAEQSCRIESVQKRAFKIIYGPGDYSDICGKQGLSTLASRRTEICTSFFNNSVLQKNSCLHCQGHVGKRRKN